MRKSQRLRVRRPQTPLVMMESAAIRARRFPPRSGGRHVPTQGLEEVGSRDDVKAGASHRIQLVSSGGMGSRLNWFRRARACR